MIKLQQFWFLELFFARTFWCI